MSELTDEQLIDLYVGGALHVDGLRAVADAAVQAAREGQEPVAWMSPGKERLEFSRHDTVYGSHTIPLYTTPPAATVVPVEPTPEMVQSGYDDSWEGDVTDEQMFAAVYRAMLAKSTPC